MPDILLFVTNPNQLSEMLGCQCDDEKEVVEQQPQQYAEEAFDASVPLLQYLHAHELHVHSKTLLLEQNLAKQAHLA